MIKKLNNLNRWQNLALVLILLLAAYGLGSRALDTGSWWQYSGTFILLVAALKFFVHVFKK